MCGLPLRMSDLLQAIQWNPWQSRSFETYQNPSYQNPLATIDIDINTYKPLLKISK